MAKPKEALNLIEVYRRRAEQRSASRQHQAVASARIEPKPQRSAPTPAAVRIRPEGERLRFSLSTLGLAMAIFGCGAIVLAAFLLGRSAGFSKAQQAATLNSGMTAADPFRELRAAQPDPTVLEDLNLVRDQVQAEQARQRREARTTLEGFLDDLNYVWIERFYTAAEARSAQEYLLRAGIESRPMFE